MDKYKIFEDAILPLYNLRFNLKSYRKITDSNTFEYSNLGGGGQYTGLDRKGWLESAEYLLTGIFKYAKSNKKPLFFPKQKGKSYPKIIRASKKIAYLEGLCRTLFIATPLLKENPDLLLNKIAIADYYRNQLRDLTDSTSIVFIEDRKEDFPSQILVEFGSLAMIFFLCGDVLWKPLAQEVKDKLALKMLSYGEGPCVDNNWKYFPVFILSFFKSEGYKVDENRLEALLGEIENDYSGDGWYLDDSYDYYSMWGYQLYAAIWSNKFGKKHYPEIADRFKKNFKEMLNFYPYLFACDGKMLMWGRSSTYRFAAIAPLLFSSWNDSEDVNYGWLRRISSGALRQFVGNENFLKQSIPTLGFYGPFEACIQGYSCRASSFWLGKGYLGLTLSQSDPFWMQKENNGPWEHYGKKECHSYYSAASKIMVTHYSSIGEAEIRTYTPRNIAKASGYMRNENYNRLSYHTAFPWQADTKEGCVAMNYLIKESNKAWEPLRQYEHVSYEDGILRRRVILEKYTDAQIDLIDIPVPNGVLRIDRITTDSEKHIRLGHYALPEKTGPIKESSIHAGLRAGRKIDNGEFQLLAIPVLGWEDAITVHNKGIHPESEKSAVINLLSSIQNTTVLATLLLFKKSGEDWKEKEFDIIDIMNINERRAELKLKNNKAFNWEW